MPAQNAALYPSKRRVVSPKGERAQVRLTIDTRFTQYYFDRLVSVFKIRKRNAVAEHIIMDFKTKAAQARLQAFYKNEWQDIPFPEIDTAFVFPLTNKIRDELDRVGGEVLGGVNHSKAFRVIVAYLAFIHNLKEPERLACWNPAMNHPVKPGGDCQQNPPIAREDQLALLTRDLL